jgi:hypothetical protein
VVDTAAREAAVFARYLGVAAPPAVVAAYARGQAVLPASRPLDRLLLTVARTHPALTRVADAYARLFDRCGLLRHKLVLLLAILEVSAPAAEAFEPDPAPLLRSAGRLAAAGVGFAVALGAGVLLFGVPHAVLRLGGRT